MHSSERSRFQSLPQQWAIVWAVIRSIPRTSLETSCTPSLRLAQKCSPSSMSRARQFQLSCIASKVRLNMESIATSTALIAAIMMKTGHWDKDIRMTIRWAATGNKWRASFHLIIRPRLHTSLRWRTIGTPSMSVKFTLALHSSPLRSSMTLDLDPSFLRLVTVQLVREIYWTLAIRAVFHIWVPRLMRQSAIWVEIRWLVS